MYHAIKKRIKTSIYFFFLLKSNIRRINFAFQTTKCLKLQSNYSNIACIKFLCMLHLKYCAITLSD